MSPQNERCGRRLGARGRVVVVAATLTVLLAPVERVSADGAAESREAARGPLGAVAATSPLAAAAGLDMLARGGNAIDAAAAAVFTVGVVRPETCGIGGGGFLVYRGADGEVAALDFREISPANDYVYREDVRVPGSTEVKTSRGTGHGVVGVPGTVKGMLAALDRYGSGKVTRAETLAAASHHARNGFPVSRTTSGSIARREFEMALFPETARTYLTPVPNNYWGDPLRPSLSYAPGATMKLPDYADTLDRIAKNGDAEFYAPGHVTADRLVAEMTRVSPYEAGGDKSSMTAEDLRSYRVVWRTPVVTRYRGHEVIGMPAPSSGGTAVAEMLNILEGYDLEDLGRSSADHLHLLLEAQKIAWADRAAYLADPDHVAIPPQLTTKSYAEDRRGDISLAEAGNPLAGSFPGYDPWIETTASEEGDNTTHVSVIDAAGNAVAVTCSIEQALGSLIVPEGLGFLLNSTLTDFTCSPRYEPGGTCDPTSPNAPEAGKRPRSSQTPTIVVRRGQPLLVVGAQGGESIIMGVAQAIVNVVDFGLDPAEAIDAPRVDCCPPGSDVVTVEDGRFAAAVLQDLAARGHALHGLGDYGIAPILQAAGIDLRSGERLAATDPRDGDCGAAVHEADGKTIEYQC